MIALKIFRVQIDFSQAYSSVFAFWKHNVRYGISQIV
jgi:hypothetical protein